MEIMEFCQKVKRSLAADIEEGIKISVKEITKNNGVVLHSITVSKTGMNISPNIYLDGLYAAYEQGENFRTVMAEVRKIYEDSKMETNIDMGFFLNYEKVKEKVVYKAIGCRKNRELLRHIPHVLFLDMALVFYCHVPQKELEGATILIHNSHLKMWGITKEHLYWDARRNTGNILPAKILSIEEVMQDFFSGSMNNAGTEKKCKGEEQCREERERNSGEQYREDVEHRSEEMPENGENCGNGEKYKDGEERESTESGKTDGPGREGSGRMYVLGNERKLFGASAMFYEGVLDEFSKKMKKSLFILPSSVHEVILIPDDGFQDPEELWNMVCEINGTQVEPEDVLTDSLYYFSKKCKKIKKLF